MQLGKGEGFVKETVRTTFISTLTALNIAVLGRLSNYTARDEKVFLFLNPAKNLHCSKLTKTFNLSLLSLNPKISKATVLG